MLKTLADNVAYGGGALMIIAVTVVVVLGCALLARVLSQMLVAAWREDHKPDDRDPRAR